MVFVLLIIGAFTLVISIGSSPQDGTGTFISNESWKIGYDHRGISHLSSNSDPYKVNVISRLIDANVRFRIGGGDWQPIDSSRQMEVKGNTVRFINNKQGSPFSMEQTFTLKDEVLDWDIVLENNTSQTIDIGDISISIPLRGNSGREPVNLFEKGYLRHFFISGDGGLRLRTGGEFI